MIGFPLDSRVTYDADGTPSYDRAIGAEPYRKLLKELFNTGVLPTVSTNMQVVAGDGMNVTVMAGFAIVEGCMKLAENNETLTIEPADATFSRIDTVVLRLDDNEDVRSCEYAVIKGTPASSPEAPELVRNNSIYDIGLANITVRANSSIISQAQINDTRYDSTRCGVMSAIAEFDTTTLYAQIEDDLNRFQTVNEANFVEWVETIKNILDEETAGHLQLEIDSIREDVDEALTSKVDYDDLLSLEEIQAGTPEILNNKAPNGTSIQELNNNFTNIGKVCDLLGTSTTLEGRIPITPSQLDEYKSLIFKVYCFRTVGNYYTSTLLEISTAYLKQLLTNEAFNFGNSIDSNQLTGYIIFNASEGVTYWYGQYQNVNYRNMSCSVFGIK